MTLAKRLTLFGLLGPLLGFITAFWVLLQILTVAVGDPPTIHPGQVVLLPIAYMLGLIPALIAGAIDHSGRNARFGLIYTGLAGYLLGFLPISISLVMGGMSGPSVLIFGLVGAIPAMICSAVARRMSRAGK